MPEALPTVNPLLVLMTLALLGSVVGAWIWAILRLAFGATVLPRFEPKLVPWGGKSVLAVLLVWLAIQVAVPKIYQFATRGPVARPPGARVPFNPAEMMTASALQNLTVLIVIPLLLGLTAGARLGDFGTIGNKTGRQVLQGMTAWPLAAPVVYGMMLAAVAIWGRESHPLETAIQTDGVGGKAVIFFLAGVVFAPAAEELIFRGVLLGWLTRLVLEPRAGKRQPSSLLDEGPSALDPSSATFHPNDDVSIATTPASELLGDPGGPYPSTEAAVNFAAPQSRPPTDEGPQTGPGVMTRLAVANLAVSILFAALHYTVWPTPVPIFFLSLVLGLLYQRTGSLVAPVALHMTFNGITTVLMFLVMGSSAPTGPQKPTIPVPLPKPVDPITTPPVAVIPGR